MTHPASLPDDLPPHVHTVQEAWQSLLDEAKKLQDAADSLQRKDEALRSALENVVCLQKLFGWRAVYPGLNRRLLQDQLRDVHRQYRALTSQLEAIQRRVGRLAMMVQITDKVLQLREPRSLLAIQEKPRLSRLREIRAAIARPFHGALNPTPELLRRRLALFGLLVPSKLREKIYFPATEDLVYDYALARKLYRTKWAQRWIGLVFFGRTIALWLATLRTAGLGWIIDVARNLYDRLSR